MKTKTALITGASQGIGRAVAEELAARGYRLVLGYHASAHAAGELEASLHAQGAEVYAVQADVGDTGQAQALVEAGLARFGFIDVLINNAGIGEQRLFTEIEPAQWRRMMDVHVGGAYACTRAVLPAMLRAHSGGIINISSIWGVVGASCEVHYSTAKAALIGFTKALAKEVGPSGIRVNCVAPGVIDTRMNAPLTPADRAALAEETPLGRLGTPQEVAKAVAFLAGDEAAFITGQVLGVDGGFGH